MCCVGPPRGDSVRPDNPPGRRSAGAQSSQSDLQPAGTAAGSSQAPPEGRPPPSERGPALAPPGQMAGAVILKRGNEIPSTFERCVFLAGADGAEWESAAVQKLLAAGFDKGVIIVGDAAAEEVGTGGWRYKATQLADAIVCHVPVGAERDDYMTREIMAWAESGKMFCSAEEGSWVDELVAPHGIAPARDLDALIANSFKMVKNGAERKDAERLVPLMIWRTQPWALWYSNLTAAGNRLDGAKVEWTFRVGPGKAFVLFWAVHANIWVEAEGRNKANEVVIARPDIACVLAYMPGEQMLDTEIIVIKEFRSPCRNEHAFVYELPGGSSFKPNSDVYQTAADELFEETGIRVDKSRLRKEMSRQAAATVTTHHVHLFSCELTVEEMDVARKCAEEKAVFGNAHETERTYIETVTLREAIPASKMDFTTLGMIMQTIGIFYGIMRAKEEGQLADRLMRLGLDTVDEERQDAKAHHVTSSTVSRTCPCRRPGR